MQEGRREREHGYWNMVISLTYVDSYRFSCSKGKIAGKMLGDVIGRIGAVLPRTDEDPEEWLGQQQQYIRVDDGWTMKGLCQDTLKSSLRITSRTGWSN